MKEFKKLEKEFSRREIAEAYIIPGNATQEQRDKAQALFAAHRKKLASRQPESEKLMMRILQLKFLMEDYIEKNEYNDRLSFGFFLKEYIGLLNIKNKEFADDICINAVELSHYLSNRRKPNEELMIRLEIHSNKNIPAIYWYKILEKETEHEISTDVQMRRQEAKNVKNKLEFSL